MFELLRKLTEFGYERVQTIGAKGEFSQRGGILDVFPINTANAFRLEFSGNRIAEIFEVRLQGRPKSDFKKPAIAIAHGRMHKKQIVKTMDAFGAGQIDILIATTIIENGLDFPNVNTLIVDKATKLGLAQSYQLRGRIGHSNIQAYAYFLYKAKSLTDIAKQRLDALKEAEALGYSYHIAMRDLEIRGAGNILGKEQSGSINAVGLNLYMQMLNEAVEELKISEN